MVYAVIWDDSKERAEEIDTVDMEEKEFATGSVGYHGSQKVDLGDEEYQANFQLVKVHSKPEEREDEDDSS